MFELGVRVGLFLFGWVCGLLGTLFYIAGLKHSEKIESGQAVFGKPKKLETMVNTDREFVDNIRQERYEKGYEPYLNEETG